MRAPIYHSLSTLEDLLQRDEQRKKDGFLPKIKIGRVVHPGKSGKVVIVPVTQEEKFYHDNRPLYNEEQQDGGSGDGQEGDVVGIEPDEEDQDGENGPGRHGGGDHGSGTDAYELGKVLTEKLKLPNLKDKGKKHLAEPKYELTDKNRGSGQILDKKATLLNIIRTNMSLGLIDDPTTANLDNLVIDPRDKVYRILSREVQYEAHAIVFFARDYSGSMMGRPAEVVVSEHLLIYCWLMFQYNRKVDTRFVLHDTEAKEVPDFETYYRLKVGGGTEIFSVFEHINKVVENEGLARDNNIYIFYGSDGDDISGDEYESKLIAGLNKSVSYCNRIGMTVVNGDYRKTTFESAVELSGLLKSMPSLIRLDKIDQNASQERLIEGIRKLVG